MKKINILIILGLFVLLVGAVQPVYADAWNYQNAPVRFQIQFEYGTNEAAHLNAALGKFNGLLNAYSVNQKQNTEKQLSAAASDLSSSLEEFNIALLEVYPTLFEEEQLAVREAYSSLGLYLEDLAVRTNAVFGREVFQIIYDLPLSKTSNSTSQGRFITIIDDLNSDL